MTRVAVIGNAGGGKSTMCRQLSQALNIEAYAIDNIQWKPGWVAVSSIEFKQKHDSLLALDKWIIDGWGNWEAIEARFIRADTIIFVDHPLHIHYWWSLKRQLKYIFRPRPDEPEGCPMLPMTWPLMKMIWRIHREARPRLIEMLESFRHSKQLFHIRSPRELQYFIEVYS